LHLNQAELHYWVDTGLKLNQNFRHLVNALQTLFGKNIIIYLLGADEFKKSSNKCKRVLVIGVVVEAIVDRVGSKETDLKFKGVCTVIDTS